MILSDTKNAARNANAKCRTQECDG